MDLTSDALDLKRLSAYMQNLEKRISRIESQMQIDSSSEEEEIKLSKGISQKIYYQTDSLEDTIGQYWFAKVGIVLLLTGIVFLLTFPYQNLPPLIPSLAGFVLSGTMVFISRYSSKSLPFLSHYFFGGSLLLLYFSTLRLHFFSDVHFIESASFETLLLMLTSVVYLIIAYRRKSVYLNFIGITLVSVAILISDNTFFLFFCLTALALYLVFLRIKFSWSGLLGYGMTIVFLSNLFWFLNNPIAGHSFSIQVRSSLNLYAFLLYCLIFAVGNLNRNNKETDDSKVIAATFINCFWGYGLFFIICMISYKSMLPRANLIASILYLVIAILFWTKEKSKYSTFFYSIVGYTALSIAIVSQFSKPDFFVWLSWQSILVVSTAIWFRSKIIIVANFIMYLLIFFSYLVLAGNLGIISLSFGVVAILSARILNWQKDRLDLKTEMMRLAYLGAAFFIFPYSLYHIVPQNYVSLSWTVVALIYYFMSVILKNKKYRWMALLTFLLTVVHILFVDITYLDPSFRIISFIVVGIVLVLISIYYSRTKLRDEKKSNDQSLPGKANSVIGKT
jgi:hypothetical protein